MEQLIIKGGRPLEGTVRASGAKNAITKMLVASLLSDKKCTFTNVPNIAEVHTTVSLCQELGMHVSWDLEQGILEAQTKELISTYVPQRFSGANRIPILLIGALLGRSREDIIIPTVGGCKIGKRPVDFHIASLQALGANIEYREMKKEGAYFAHAHHGLKGAVIELPYPSVGATENTMLAAVLAQGKTVIKNAAIEPEIMDLILFLQKLGVNIQLDGTRTITIEETKTFYEVKHRVLTDRIEAASLGMAAIATQGRVFVEGAEHLHMISFLNQLRRIGAGFSIEEDGIEFFYSGSLQGGLHLETDVHPGFLTDWQQPFVVLLSQAQGSSIIHETVYENRFGYTDMLSKMGGKMHLFHDCLGHRACRFASQNFGHSLVIHGPTTLTGASIEIPDLRAGFAYVMAALVAKEESIITGLHYLDRGYEKIDTKLALLGADVRRVSLVEALV
ncbi:MAG: UDP-N-acetylglucosamine 1-carboxyvinyltransferase [Simkaniaceae bacterium]|nr:UDP-N-acetylglucosamine 1-carboxyvinyltransferase [Simkaniaceae bacterium]